MINTLKIATDGYLKRQTKAALVIAVSGYLSLSPIQSVSGGGYAYSQQTNILEQRRQQIKKNEQEWMLFIKIFTEQCQ